MTKASFQLHLSTAVVLMFFASYFVYKNTRILEDYGIADGSHANAVLQPEKVWSFGWPLAVSNQRFPFVLTAQIPLILLNLLMAVIILLMLAGAIEAFIRLNEAKPKAPDSKC